VIFANAIILFTYLEWNFAKSISFSHLSLKLFLMEKSENKYCLQKTLYYVGICHGQIFYYRGWWWYEYAELSKWMNEWWWWWSKSTLKLNKMNAGQVDIVD
jgi:hypothetical protein